MQVARQQQWQQIMQMTEQLHQLSADESWQAMVELESTRFTSLQSFFATAVSENEADEIKAGIEQILKSDGQLMQHSKTEHRNLSKVLKKMSTGKQAIKAYGRFQGSSI